MGQAVFIVLLLFFASKVHSIDYFVITGTLSSSEACTSEIIVGGKYVKTLQTGDFSFVVPSVYFSGQISIGIKSVDCKNTRAYPYLHIKSMQSFEEYCKTTITRI